MKSDGNLLLLIKYGLFFQISSFLYSSGFLKFIKLAYH